MYAIVKQGGKQCLMVPGKKLSVEKIPGEVHDEVSFSEVLLYDDGQEGVHIGDPCLSHILVRAKIVAQGLGDKIRIINFKRRKNHMNTFLTNIKHKAPPKMKPHHELHPEFSQHSVSSQEPSDTAYRLVLQSHTSYNHYLL
jgi:large subunit ribosomal protein L21